MRERESERRREGEKERKRESERRREGEERHVENYISSVELKALLNTAFQHLTPATPLPSPFLSPLSLSRRYLDKIAQRLAALAPATKVVFGITTPEMCSKATDDIVQSNNVNNVAETTSLPSLPSPEF